MELENHVEEARCCFCFFCGKHPSDFVLWGEDRLLKEYSLLICASCGNRWLDTGYLDPHDVVIFLPEARWTRFGPPRHGDTTTSVQADPDFGLAPEVCTCIRTGIAC